MCWASKTKPVLHIAGEDIPVKKVLSIVAGGVHSPCYSEFIWELNKVYENKLENPKNVYGCYTINIGLHSCKTIKTKSYTSFFGNTCTSWVNGTYYLFAKSPYDYIFDAIIPKGSEYYLNENGNYVSNKLKIIGKAKVQN